MENTIKNKGILKITQINLYKKKKEVNPQI